MKLSLTADDLGHIVQAHAMACEYERQLLSTEDPELRKNIAEHILTVVIPGYNGEITKQMQNGGLRKLGVAIDIGKLEKVCRAVLKNNLKPLRSYKPEGLIYDIRRDYEAKKKVKH